VPAPTELVELVDRARTFTHHQWVRATIVGGAALLTALVLDAGITRAGTIAVVLPVALLGAAYLLMHPGVAFGVLVGSTILFEEATEALFDVSAHPFYAYVGPVQPTDLLFALFLGSLVLSGSLRRGSGPNEVDLRDLGPFDLPLLLLAVAIGFGAVNGFFGLHLPAALLIETKTLVYLVAVPVLGAALLRRPEQRRHAVAVIGVLVVVKAAYGVLAILLGRGLDDGNGGELTYYEAPINHLCLLYLLAVLAAPFAGAKLPRWAIVGTPVVAACLALSLRRSFWIAFVISVVLLLIVATGQRGRPWLFVGGVAIGLALWLTLIAGGSTDSTNPVVARAQSINAEDIRSNSTDRYRLEEQDNIIAELRRSPSTGIGLGVPWTARSPLSEEHIGGRAYVHNIVLWYWLKLGPLGLAAYLWLTATATWCAYQVWRRARDATERAVGLALAAGAVGLAIAEMTGSFSGAGLRFTVVLGALLAWTIAAYGDLADERSPDAAATDPMLQATAPTSA
jgi:O-antigen ligase